MSAHIRPLTMVLICVGIIGLATGVTLFVLGFDHAAFWVVVGTMVAGLLVRAAFAVLSKAPSRDESAG
jgi:hypothetical protein